MLDRNKGTPKAGIPTGLVELEYPPEKWLRQKNKPYVLRVIFPKGCQVTYAPPTNPLGGPIRKNADGEIVTMGQIVNAYSKRPPGKLLEWLLAFQKRSDLDMFVKVIEDNSKPRKRIYGQYPMYSWMIGDPSRPLGSSGQEKRPIESSQKDSSTNKLPSLSIRERVSSNPKEEDARDKADRAAQQRLMERKRKEESLLLERKLEASLTNEPEKRDNLLEGAWKISYQTIFVDYLQICKELSTTYYSVINDIQAKYNKEKESGKDTTGNKGINKSNPEKQANLMWSDPSQWSTIKWESLSDIKPGLLESAVLNVVMLCKVISEFRGMAEAHVKDIIDEMPLPPNYRKHSPDTDGIEDFTRDRAPTRLVYTSQFYVVTLAIPEKAQSLKADNYQKNFINDRSVVFPNRSKRS